MQAWQDIMAEKSGAPRNLVDQYTKSIFDIIGNTPLVKLARIPRDEGVISGVLVKIEYVNPTGSLKDRIYYEMITEALQTGALKPGMTIIEASTGNAGISCAFVGRALGFPVTIVIPSGMSGERMKTIQSYGAEIVKTPGSESDVDLSLHKIIELKKANPRKYWEPNQFSNPANVEAHYKSTGPEIWKQTAGRVDCFVASQGTGGTLTGVGRYLRKMKRSIRLYAVEPQEAPILAHRKWGTHRIEGIGDGFVPDNLDLSLLTGVITVSSDEAITMAKRLALEEGIFCGISSGCNIAAVIKLLKRHSEYRRIVTMINDTGQRYFSTELCGEAKNVEIPEREHILDKRTIEILDRYSPAWEIIE